MSLNDQPMSRRAARMLEREATGAIDAAALIRASGEAPSAPVVEPAVEPVEQEAADRGRPVVSDAIFAGASWAAPIVRAEPVAPDQIVRRRDLRDRPADAPPVGLTGEIAFDPAALTDPRPGPEFSAPESVISELPAVVAEPAVIETPAASSFFAAPAPGAAPSWANAAAPSSPALEAVQDAPQGRSVSRRARRAAEFTPPEPPFAEPVDPSLVLSVPVDPAPVAPALVEAAPVAPTPVEEPPVDEAPAEEAPIDVVRTSTVPRPTIDTSWSAPTGHWSRQLESTDADDELESTFSRSVGATSPTTNALVLPGPPPLDFSGPLTATGEIMLTGSIKLPDAFSRTGATDQVDLADRDELDDLFEEAPTPDFMSESQPIRAAAAVGGEHALGSPIVSTVKPGRGNKVLTGLLITACALAVVVTGLIITAFATGIV